MNLITMAHLGEAQGIIDLLGLERSAENLYESGKYVLLITGEGPFEAATAVSAIIQRYNFTHAYNMGIVGSLNKKLEIGSIHPVRSIYLIIDGKPYFKTFQCASQGLDCLTSFERILAPEKASILEGVGELVDREAWGVAFACKQNGLPFSCYKIISDQAGTLQACELVKTQAMYFAELISMEAKKILNLKNEAVLEGFHFTFSTKIQFEQRLKMICLRDDKSTSDAIDDLDLESLRELKILPKERTKLLLTRMDHKLDPLKEKITSLLNSWKNPWIEKGINLQIDPAFEASEVNVNFKAANNEELKQKLELLSHLSLTPYLEIREGHVE